jgi:hypothetical protein
MMEGVHIQKMQMISRQSVIIERLVETLPTSNKHDFDRLSLASISIATFVFTTTFKIHKMTLKSHFLFNCCNMFRPYKAIPGRLLIEIAALHQLISQYITCYYKMIW